MSSAPNPLIAAWHDVARRHAGATAVVEAESGQRWTFEELAAAGIQAARCQRPSPHASPTGTEVIHPQGHGAEFIIGLLAAWEAGKTACPLETGMLEPTEDVWHGLHRRFPSAVLAKTTSGSTGSPRHVVFSADQLAADARAIIDTMGLHPGLPNVGAISLAHSYGFSNLILPLLLHGIPLVLAASALPESVRAALAIVASGVAGGTQATLPGVPAMWRAWHAAGLADPLRVGIALSAGAPLPLPLERQVWAESGVKLHNFLGSSECGGIVYDKSAGPREAATLAGTALEGVALSLDSDGRLVVRSPAVGLGFWPPAMDASSEPDPDLRPGVFTTGDLAEERADGWHLLGRAADTINVAGRKLHPLEIESLLRAHPAIRECLVFSVPSTDATRGEEIVVAVALEPDADAAWNDLPGWLGGQLPSWKRPRHWWRCPELAATTRGKLPRATWRERFLAEAGYGDVRLVERQGP